MQLFAAHMFLPSWPLRLPPAAFVPLAAVFICLFRRRSGAQKGGLCTACALGMPGGAGCAVGGRLGGGAACVFHGRQPAAAHRAGGRNQPRYADGMVRARLEVLAAGGRVLGPLRRFCITCPAFPEAQPGEIYEGAFSLSALEKDSYYYGNLADRVYLEGESGPGNARNKRGAAL